MRALVIALVIAAVPAVAHAQEPERRVSATMSPVHLIIPFGEVTVEARAADHMGVAVIGGFGVFDSEGTDVNLYELGGQFSYYVTRPFSGWHAGVELMYVHASAASDSAVFADGLSIGPMGGYKWIASFGLTLVAQGGVAIVAIEGSNAESEKRVSPLLNLNAGWSF